MGGGKQLMENIGGGTWNFSPPNQWETHMAFWEIFIQTPFKKQKRRIFQGRIPSGVAQETGRLKLVGTRGGISLLSSRRINITLKMERTSSVAEQSQGFSS